MNKTAKNKVNAILEEIYLEKESKKILGIYGRVLDNAQNE